MNNYDVEIAKIEAAVKSAHHRLDTHEKQLEDIHELTTSVKILANNMEHMLEEQKAQGLRLDRLESAPADEAKFYKRQIVSCIITAVVGAIVGALLALLV